MNRQLQRRQDSIDRLLEASLEVLETVGFEMLRVADVIARSGMSDGSLFRYFRTKPDLVRASFVRSSQERLIRIRDRFPDDGPAPTYASIAQALWSGHVHTRFRWTYELLAAASHDTTLAASLGDVVAEEHQAVLDLTADLLAAASGAEPADVAMLADMFVGTIDGIVMNLLAKDDETTAPPHLAYLAKLAEAIGAEPPSFPSESLPVAAGQLVPSPPVPGTEALPMAERVLQATVDLLETNAFSTLRALDAAARAGVSEGALYRYFPTKVDLIRAALERSLQEHYDRYVAVIAEQPSGPIDRRALFEMLWDVLTHPRSRWTFELYAAASHQPELGIAVLETITNHQAKTNALAFDLITRGPFVSKDSLILMGVVATCTQGLALVGKSTPADRERTIGWLLAMTEHVYGSQS